MDHGNGFRRPRRGFQFIRWCVRRSGQPERARPLCHVAAGPRQGDDRRRGTGQAQLPAMPALPALGLQEELLEPAARIMQGMRARSGGGDLGAAIGKGS